MILQRAALETALALGEIPDVFHCHDGHTAFLPAILRESPRFAGSLRASTAVVSIHNAGRGYHQEVWDPVFAGLLTGLPTDVLGKGLLNGPSIRFSSRAPTRGCSRCRSVMQRSSWPSEALR